MLHKVASDQATVSIILPRLATFTTFAMGLKMAKHLHETNALVSLNTGIAILNNNM
jgi:hypothetical protein